MFAILAIVSCEYKTEAEIEEAKRLGGFNIVTVDSCEYLIKSEKGGGGYQGYGYFAHKGNCRFCKERDSIKWEKRRKELEELVEQLKK